MASMVATIPLTDEVEVYEEVSFAAMTPQTSESGEAVWVYDCPCGDIFTATAASLKAGARIFECPTCSLRIRVTITEEQLQVLG